MRIMFLIILYVLIPNSSMSQSISSIQNKIDRLEKKMESNAQQIKENEDKLDKLQKEYSDTEFEIRDVKKASSIKIEEKINNVEKLQDSLPTIKSEVDRLKIKEEKLCNRTVPEEDYILAKIECDTVSGHVDNKISQYNRNVKLIRRNTDEAKIIVEKSDKKVSSLKLDLKDIESDFNATAEKIVLLGVENENIKSQIGQLSNVSDPSKYGGKVDGSSNSIKNPGSVVNGQLQGCKCGVCQGTKGQYCKKCSSKICPAL